jgi:signal transduction histidine kinase
MELNWVILYLIYGQVFFIMGLITGLQWRRNSQLELAHALPWLAAFGIADGFNEWGYIFVPLLAIELPTNLASVLYLAHLLLLGLSFFFLLQFGVELLLPMFPRRRWLRDVPGVVFLLWLGVLLFSAVQGAHLDVLLSLGDVWSRYFLCFPGAMLAFLGLIRQARQMREMDLSRIAIYVTGAAVAFLVYGFVGGLVVSAAPFFPANLLNYELLIHTIRIPAPIFRSLCGLAMAVFVVRSLGVFHAESDRRIEQMEKERLLAADRERIGRELHDGTIQNIYAAGLGLEEAQHFISEDPTRTRDQIQAVMATLNRTIQDIRNYIFDLHTAEPTRTLKTALDSLLHEMQSGSLLQTDLQMCDQQCGKLTVSQIAHLTQIVREALSNVIQHARATCVVVSLRCEGGKLRLTVADDGIGIPMTTTGSDGHRGRGISNMRSRAHLMGGECTLESTLGQGTRVAIAIPCGREVAG